jgi:hypothetical protein
VLTEIVQIKRFLANYYHLPLANADNDMMCRIVGLVPDCEHVIPLGVSLTPTRVVVKDDRIHIGPKE